MAGSPLRARIGSDADTQVDGRLLAGYGFALDGILDGATGFVEAQAGYRARDLPAADELRVDLAVGVRPVPDWLLLVQSFTTIAAERATPRPPQTSTKLQLSVVYDLAPSWSVQMGGFATLVGEAALEERGLLAAVWYRF